jgi:putative phosphoribosyl transferase
MTERPFADRVDAGRALAVRLAGAAAPGLVVLGLPRGGVVVAAEVARALGCALDVVVVRKVGLPWQPELAMGAVAAAGEEVETVRDERVLTGAAVDDETFERARAREITELRRREAAYLQGRPRVPLAGRPVVLVDDGLATGSTVEAAVAELRAVHPGWLGLIVPVADASAWARVRPLVDGGTALLMRTPMRAVSVDYADFTQLDDDVVREALARWG